MRLLERIETLQNQIDDAFAVGNVVRVKLLQERLDKSLQRARQRSLTPTNADWKAPKTTQSEQDVSFTPLKLSNAIIANIDRSLGAGAAGWQSNPFSDEFMFASTGLANAPTQAKAAKDAD